MEDVLSGKEVFEEKIITERESFKQIEKGYQLEVFLPCVMVEFRDTYLDH